MSIRMPHNVLAGDVITSVGASAPASPIAGALWLDTSAPAQATPLVYGPNGEILLHTAGAGSVGRITRTAGPQEDVHLRSGDAAGSFAFVEAQSGNYHAANCYWDGGNWQRFDTGAAAALFIIQPNGFMQVQTAAAGANPITWAFNQAESMVNFALALDPPRVKMYRNVDLSVASGVVTAVAWTTTLQNAGGAGGTAMWAGGQPTRYTAPVNGFYEFGGTLVWNAGTGGSYRATFLRANGATFLGAQHGPVSAGGFVRNTVHAMCGLVAGDYMELCALHDQGAAFSVVQSGVEVAAWGRWVSPL